MTPHQERKILSEIEELQATAQALAKAMNRLISAVGRLDKAAWDMADDDTQEIDVNYHQEGGLDNDFDVMGPPTWGAPF